MEVVILVEFITTNADTYAKILQYAHTHTYNKSFCTIYTHELVHIVYILLLSCPCSAGDADQAGE